MDAEPSPKRKQKKSGAVSRGDARRKDDSAGLPLLRGAKPDAAHTLRFHLRRFDPKDLGLILTGFSVLAMAPLLEFVLVSRKDAAQLSQGFDRKGIEFDGLGSLFENGVFGVASGGLLGNADGVISPLSGRDPTDLVVGYRVEGGAPSASSVSKPEPGSEKRDNWREAVSAAERGAGQAARRASPPRPNPKLAGTLSGLSAGSGGSSSSALELSAPASRGLFSSRVRAGDHMRPIRALPEYRGLERGSGGPASPYLDPKKVVSAAPGGGASGAASPPSSQGAGSASGGVSAPGPDAEKQANVGVQDNRNIQPKEKKESLAETARKMNMEQAIKLKWDKKRYDQIERKKMKEQIAMQTASQAFLKILDKLLAGGSGGGSGDGGSSGSSPGGGGAPQGQQVQTPEGGMGTDRTGAQNFVRNGWVYRNGKLQLREFGTGRFVDAPPGFDTIKERFDPRDLFVDKNKNLVDKTGKPAQPKTAPASKS